jgi:hypothetical protein
LESGINIPDKHPGSYFKSLVAIFFGLKIIKFFVADPYPGFGAFLALDQGSGIRDGKLRIRGKHPGSAALSVPVPYVNNSSSCRFLFNA